HRGERRVLAQRGPASGQRRQGRQRTPWAAGGQGDPDGAGGGHHVRPVVFLLLGLSVLPGCSCYGTRASDVLQRMETQDKILPYAANEPCADGRGMRTPVENTISREAVVGAPGITSGMVNGELVTQVPIPVTPELLARGRHRFEVVCSNCHGLVGNGDSMIA